MTYLALLGWSGKLPVAELIPEGHEDVSIRTADGWFHCQVKSRREMRGDFTFGEVGKFIEAAWKTFEKRLVSQPKSQLAIVLERPVMGFETGWDQSIGDVDTLVRELRPILEAKFSDTTHVDSVLALTSIVVIQSPKEDGFRLLADKLEHLTEVCTAHFRAVQDAVVHAADENGIRHITNAASLTTMDVQRLLDESTELMQVDRLEEALRSGACRVVDFSRPLRVPFKTVE